MGYYLNPVRRGSFSPSQLKELGELVKQTITRLGITDVSQKNEVAARILPLYIQGSRTGDQILDAIQRMQISGLTPGDRLSTSHPNVKRMRNGLASNV